MNLDEIKNLWHSHDNQAHITPEINHYLLKTVSLGKTKSLISEFKWTQALELIFNVPFLLFFMGYVYDHMWQLKFAVPALFLAILLLYSTVCNIYFLHSIFSMDYSMSLTKVQRKIESIRLYERREIKLLFVLIPLFSQAFLIVFCELLIGLDLYLYPTYMISHFAGSIVVGIIIAGLLMKFPDKKLKAASEFLKEIKEYES